ncbi:MAG: endopeptidase, partial [bacterium]|nr:endopeptidase [bacterium]
MRTTSTRRVLGLYVAVAFCLTLVTGLCWALVPPEEGSESEAGADLKAKEFFLPELYISSSHQHIDQVLAKLPNRVAWENFQATRDQAGKGRTHAFIDPRSGAATNLLDAEPLIPGKGIGNQVTLAELGGRFGYKVGQIGPPEVADAVLDFVSRNQRLLGVDMTQLGDVHAVRVNGELWNVNIPQTYHGIPVRHGRLAATINNGNLVLIGTETWGNVLGLSQVPLHSDKDAMALGFDYAGGQSPIDEIVLAPTLEVVPVAPKPGAYRDSIGKGYGHRLVWSFQFQRVPEMATWEVLVDAHSGEVISFQDVNDYATISGGVYPVTSTEICPTPGTCGVMQSDWPMPWADTGLAAPNNYTNSGGVFDGSGSTTTTLSGLYVDIIDICGPISNSGSPSIDLGGVNGDHDCTTGGGSAGNTPASRTAFYEVNKLMEMARSWLPDNTWLQQTLTTRVNLTQTCNAYYSPSYDTINFYRSGGGCRNTGELAGVFDHEWGHGLDYHDTGGSSSNPGEAYADIAEIYRIQHSCVGHGFWWTYNRGCGMTADGTGYNQNEAQTGASHCDLDCSGVRDADWDMHADHTPDTPLNFVCTSCISGGAPCGRQVHCAAAPPRQAAWDFVVRDLQSAPFNLDNQTAFIVGNKVFYQGSGNVGAWYTCTCGSSSGGCGATNGYMQWLAADDDDGNINNGTPHMTALYNAFNRHEIACATPTPTNSGCAGAPTGTATLSATPGNKQVALSWTAVASASKYWVFRTEGHAGCDYNKALIAETTGLSYTDPDVANGREYYYNVVAVGTSDACFGPVSNCATASPVGAPDFNLSCSPANHTLQQGASATSTCTVSSEFGWTGTADLTCSGNPAGITCGFVPTSVSPPANGTADSTLTLTVDLGQATGSYGFDVVATSGAETRTSGMSVLVVPEGTNGPQDAVYNGTYQAPACLIPGSECDSLALVDGRDGLGPEPNQPNTIGGTCADGTSGTYHSD